MSSSFEINNYPSVNIIERGVLDADVAVGANTVTLQNVQNFTANTYFVLGNMGQENAEIVQILSVAGKIITLVAPVKNRHDRFEDVLRLFGNQIKLYSAPNTDGNMPADGSFVPVSGGLTDIDADQQQTLVTDTAGSSANWYKYTYYNSTTTAETDISNSKGARGAGYGDYCSIWDVKKAAGLQNNHNIADSDVDFVRQAAQSLINSKLGARYQVPFTAPINEYIAWLTAQIAAVMLLNNQGLTLRADNILTSDEMTDIFSSLQNGSTSLVGETPIEQGSGGSTGSNLSMNGWPVAATATTDPDQGGSERYFRMGYGANDYSRRY